MSKLHLSTPIRLTLGFISLYLIGSIVIFSYWSHHVSSVGIEDIDQQLLSWRDNIQHETEEQGLQGAQTIIMEEMRRYGESKHAYRIVDNRGNVVMESSLLYLPPNLDQTGKIREINAISTSASGNTEAHMRVLDFMLQNAQNSTVIIGIGMADAERQNRTLWETFAKVNILLVTLGLLLGMWFARRFSSQIQMLNRLSGQIVESGDLSQRIPISGKDEFAELSANLNALLDRIEKLVIDVRDAGDNIAHDLRTPLSRLRTEVELAIMESDSESGQAKLQNILNEVERMQSIFNTLMDLAQAESGGTTMQKMVLNFSSMLTKLLELYEAGAEEAGLKLESAIQDGLYVNGDRQMLLQAISNLLDNAIKYVPTGGKIRVSAKQRLTSIELLVEDSGPGIPEQMHEKVFKRFTQLDRSRTKGGAGLGLALARAFIKLHNGSIGIMRSGLGGAAFKITMPASSPPANGS